MGSLIDELGSTKLHWAALHDDAEEVRALLANHFPVNVANKQGDTPLHWASAAGSKKILPLLIKKGADVNSRNHAGETPLSLAADEETVTIMLSTKESLSHRRFFWDQIAAEAEAEKKKKKDKKKLRISSIFSFKKTQTPSTMRELPPTSPGIPYLLKESASMANLNGLTRQQSSEGVKKSNSLPSLDEITKERLSRDSKDLESDESEEESEETEKIRKEIEIQRRASYQPFDVKLEIEKVQGMMDNRNGVLLRPKKEQPQEQKDEDKPVDIMDVLRGGARINNRISVCWPPLMNYCFSGDYEKVMSLIAIGTDISVKTENGSTALMVASVCGHEEIVELLISQDKDGKLINAKNVFGQTAKDLAILVNKPEIVKRLDSINSNRPASVSSVSSIDKSLIKDSVKAISQLVQISNSPEPNLNAPEYLTSVVDTVKKLIYVTSESSKPEVIDANQAIIRLLSDLVKIVKESRFEEVRSISILIVNELKNCLILLQN